MTGTFVVGALYVALILLVGLYRRRPDPTHGKHRLGRAVRISDDTFAAWSSRDRDWLRYLLRENGHTDTELDDWENR